MPLREQSFPAEELPDSEGFGRRGHLQEDSNRPRRRDDFLDACDNGKLPAYSFIGPRYNNDNVNHFAANDQHPDHDVVLSLLHFREAPKLTLSSAPPPLNAEAKPNAEQPAKPRRAR
jgi:hypothetical protein